MCRVRYTAHRAHDIALAHRRRGVGRPACTPHAWDTAPTPFSHRPSALPCPPSAPSSPDLPSAPSGLLCLPGSSSPPPTQRRTQDVADDSMERARTRTRTVSVRISYRPRPISSSSASPVAHQCITHRICISPRGRGRTPSPGFSLRQRTHRMLKFGVSWTQIPGQDRGSEAAAAIVAHAGACTLRPPSPAQIPPTRAYALSISSLSLSLSLGDRRSSRSHLSGCGFCFLDFVTLRDAGLGAPLPYVRQLESRRFVCSWWDDYLAHVWRHNA